jgi:hypothetical protein
MANALLPSRFVERFSRLLLGVQPMDALRLQRLNERVEMRVEPAPMLEPLTDDQQRWLEARIDSGVPLSDSWRRVPRHASARHVLSYGAGQGNSVDIRVLNASERIVPRRLRVPLVPLGMPEDMSILDALPSALRSRSPHFYPGATYETNERVTGLRGRVVVNAGGLRVVRWPRVVVRAADGGAPMAWAHGDQHGEFLLILPPEAIASPAVQLPRTLTLSVTAFGRRGLPAVVPPQLVQWADLFWDVPLETVGAPGVLPANDDVSLGRTIPADYDGSVTQLVTFSYSEIISSTVPPFDIT